MGVSVAPKEEKHTCGCGGAQRLSGTELQTRLASLAPGWNVIAGHHLEKDFTFKNFRDALTFTNHIGELAEQANHHPDIYVGWGKVKVTLWTHSVDGLTENDIELAAEIERIPR